MKIQDTLTELSLYIQSLMPDIQLRRYSITIKPDGSPVTEADIFLEKAVHTWLNARFPDISFIGEETWTDRMQVGSNWVAVLDPIDGTENFCSGLKEWGTSLSLWQKGQHRGSMLLMPELGEVMTTGNIKKIPQSRIVGFSSSFNTEISKGLSENMEGRIMGCAVYNLFNVIRGSFQRFINPKGAYSWDLLAGLALAYESGCEIELEGKKYEGQFLKPGRRYRVDIRHRYDLHLR